MLSDLDGFTMYTAVAAVSLVLVVVLMCVVFRFALRFSAQSGDDLSKTASLVRRNLPQVNFPSITTITSLSLPNIPRINIEDPPDYEEARASPCPSYEDVVTDGHYVLSRSSTNLLAVIP